MASISIESQAAGVEHVIKYDGDYFILRCDGGTWRLCDCSGEQFAVIGKRDRWTKALADALDHLSVNR